MHVSDYQTNAGESSKKNIDFWFCFVAFFFFPVHNGAVTGQLNYSLGMELYVTESL